MPIVVASAYATIGEPSGATAMASRPAAPSEIASSPTVFQTPDSASIFTTILCPNLSSLKPT
jgi:hypothetical protein